MLIQTAFALLCTLVAISPQARAQTNTADTNGSPPSLAKPTFNLGGYVEALYQWNFNRPGNGITNFRGFDNRHNSFTLSNVALDAGWDDADLIGKLTLQVGHTPSTYYLSEPNSPAANGANGANADLWKYIQQSYVGYRFVPALTVSAGVFLSPIGPESMAVKDNWNWSRSNLFFGLPFYHTGVKLTYTLQKDWAATLAAYNGWNSVVDNNENKSLSTHLTYTRPEVVLAVLYFGGVERARGAAEGRGWRHLIDSHITWHATPRLSLLAHGNGGFESTRFGPSVWTAGALYARVRVGGRLYVAARGDAFYQDVAQSARGRETPIFWPSSWVSSGTMTLDFSPHDRASFRIEYRHDHAGGATYFGSTVVGDGQEVAFVPNRVSQDTVTMGATTWF